MKRLVTVIGARPQFVKAATVSRVIANSFSEHIEEIIIHTGQHYDFNMSQVFFDELEIPRPYLNLKINSRLYTEQIPEMTSGLVHVLKELEPDAVLVYGDTNSTHAASLAAAELEIPLIHIEAGLRSFNAAMPEETNRIVADKNSTLLFVPTEKGMQNLSNESFELNRRPPFAKGSPGIFHCGDIMYDSALYFSKKSKEQSDILEKYHLSKVEFVLATIHRNTNTDDKERLNALFRSILNISVKFDIKIVVPLHPRTEKMMSESLSEELREKISTSKKLLLIPPVSYLDMIQLEGNCSLIMTDSGGVQKEAFFFKKPCIILRTETEWTELVDNGNAIIADADEEKIERAFTYLRGKRDFTWPSFYGDGKAAEFICKTIFEYI